MTPEMIEAWKELFEFMKDKNLTERLDKDVLARMIKDHGLTYLFSGRRDKVRYGLRYLYIFLDVFFKNVWQKNDYYWIGRCSLWQATWMAHDIARTCCEIKKRKI